MEKDLRESGNTYRKASKDSGKHIVIEQCQPQCDDCAAFQPFLSLFFAMEDGLEMNVIATPQLMMFSVENNCR
jgi:hypothetical protein